MHQFPTGSHGDRQSAAKSDLIFVVLLLLSLCLTRPSVFGQQFNALGGAGLVATTLVYLLSRKGRLLQLTKSAADSAVAVALLVFWCYAFAISVLGSPDVGLLLAAVAEGFCVPICFLLLTANGDVVERAFSALTRVNALLGYSIAITAVLIPLVGFGTLQLASYNIIGYEGDNNGAVLFPFSIVYGDIAEVGIYRFCSIYREAGIAQAFFVWSFVYLLYARARLFWVVGAFLGAALCGSTAVIFSFAAAAFVHFGARARHKPGQALLLIGALAVLTLLLFYLPGVGLLDKHETREASFSDRQSGMMTALPGADPWQWIFGRGLFFESVEDHRNSGINAISAISSVGAVGFCLYIATFFAGLRGRAFFSNGYRYLALVAPLLITSLLFQPIMDAPLAMALLFLRPPAKAANPAAAERPLAKSALSAPFQAKRA